MFDKIIMRGLGGALIFGGLTAAALAAGWFLAILGAVILLCAALYCAAAIAEANADTEPRPIADDVRQVKIKEKAWVRKYYNGEFDPEDDEKEEEKAPLFQNNSPARLREPLRPSRVRKFVL